MIDERKPQAGDDHADSASAPESGHGLSKRETRRRIVKAAAGAPVIFTLPGGTALAQTSLWCLDASIEQANEVLPATVVESEPDPGDWVRVRVDKLRFEQGTSGNFIEGYEIAGTWYQVTGDTVVTNPYQSPWQSRNPTNESYYLLVDYTTGDPIPHGTTSNVTPIHGTSCWTSLAGLGFPAP